MKMEISTVTIMKLWRLCWARNIVCMKKIPYFPAHKTHFFPLKYMT